MTITHTATCLSDGTKITVQHATEGTLCEMCQEPAVWANEDTALCQSCQMDLDWLVVTNIS
jgi:hypothetical protein